MLCSKHRLRRVLALGIAACALAACQKSDDAEGSAANGGSGGMNDAGVVIPVIPATDPCERAGFVFDGVSDCDVVRCPELTCECPPLDGTTSEVGVEIVLSACAPGAGCLSAASCSRVCDPAHALEVAACQARVQSAATCASDDECPLGNCREESVGSLCVEVLGCSEHGNCSVGSACRFDPDTLDVETSLPTTLGTCSGGRQGDRCYEPDHCIFGRCEGETCTGGLLGDPCMLNSNCDSGFCRITDPEASAGYCTSGQRGGACFDDGDCEQGLHCVAGICASGEVGERCEEDAECADGVCLAGRCWAGELGALCETDGDCQQGYCVASYCASGALLSPCTDSGDCNDDLICVRNVCSDGSVGMPCSTVAECEVRACVRGSCSDGSDGFECDNDIECESSRCAKPAGAEPGECTSGGVNAACVNADDCISQDCGIQHVCN